VCFDVYSKEFPAKDGALGWFIGMLAVRSMRAERKSVGKDRTRLPAASNFTSNPPGNCQDIFEEDTKMETQQETAIVKKKESPIERVKSYILSPEVKDRFQEMMGSNGIYYLNQVMILVANSDDLQKCEPKSILIAAMRAASLRLSVDPGQGQAWIIPYGDVATFQVGYKGVYELALRTNKYRFINVIDVYEGEEVIENRMTGIHMLNGKRTGNKVIARMLYFQLVSGFEKTFVMTIEEIEAHAKHYSKAYTGKNSQKSKWNDPHERPKMERKTVLINGLRRWGVFNEDDLSMLDQIESEQGWNGELPNPEDTTPPVEVKHTEAENMKALGFEPEPEKKHIDVTTGEITTTTEEAPQPEPPATEVIETSAPVNLPGNALSNYFHMAIGIVATDHLEWLLIENSRPKVAKGVEETPETLAAIREVLAVRKA
jgi:recombination protein RecT